MAKGWHHMPPSWKMHTRVPGCLNLMQERSNLNGIELKLLARCLRVYGDCSRDGGKLLVPAPLAPTPPLKPMLVCAAPPPRLAASISKRLGPPRPPLEDQSEALTGP